MKQSRNKFLIACCCVIYNELIMSFIKYQNTYITTMYDENVYKNDRQIQWCCLDTNNIIFSGHRPLIKWTLHSFFLKIVKKKYCCENCHGNYGLLIIFYSYRKQKSILFFQREIISIISRTEVDIFNHIHITHPII